MTKKNGFQFKQFFIAHDRCEMKVNTDGILLGAITNIHQTRQILDLGTGTGLIAIMLAQRTPCDCQITAVELEPNAYQQALQNSKNCPWADRLHLLQADVMTLNFATKFDLIVSNPPYFEHSLASRNTARDLARKATTSHLNWLRQSQKWLTENGKITFILPFNIGTALANQATQIGLHCIEQWQIHPKPNTAPKRLITTFCCTSTVPTAHHLTIYQQNGEYSEQFKQLTKAFYLHL